MHTMEVSDVDPAYIVRWKAAFSDNLNRRKEKTNLPWLKVAAALDSRNSGACPEQREKRCCES